MPKVKNIYETANILTYLNKRHILKQYLKAKNYLLNGNQAQVKFKERNPQNSGIWYFRINKQYRALGFFNEDNDLVIFEIDNHQ